LQRSSPLSVLECKTIQTSTVISDDFSQTSSLTRLVGIAALLRRYSPSPQVTQSRPCSPFNWPIMIYLLFSSAVRKLLTLRVCIWAIQLAHRELEQDPRLKIHPSIPKGKSSVLGPNSAPSLLLTLALAKRYLLPGTNLVFILLPLRAFLFKRLSLKAVVSKV
jgi:hypothetical protein